MHCYSENYSISSLFTDMLSGKISFEHKLQRKSGQWNGLQKSLLIDTLLNGYIVPSVTIIVENDDLWYVIDGVQRLSTILSFMRNEFKLSRVIKPIKKVRHNKGEEYVDEFDLANKKFDQLDDYIKTELRKRQISVNIIDRYTDDEINMMFVRLNNGTPLNNAQRMRTSMTDELYGRINSALENPFWAKAGMSAVDIKKSMDHQLVIQSLYSLSDSDVMGFKRENLERFLKNYQSDETTDTQRLELFEHLFDVIEVCNDTWTGKIVNSNKMSIPCYVGGAKVLLGRDNTEELLKKYAIAIEDFFNNHYKGSVYEDRCHGAGTGSRESVGYRIEYFTNMAKRILENKEPVHEILQVE